MTHHIAKHVLAEIAVEPAVEGPSHGDLVKKAIAALDGPDLTISVGPLSTTVEGGIDDVLHAVGRAHRTAADAAERVITTMRIESKKEGLDLAQRDANA
ncbi:MAG: thiamine-binding protein [Actinomycetota bacterium]|nr:thiamine-binding protein [Actinomycetota bacterium]